jgi:superoxide reductase
MSTKRNQIYKCSVCGNTVEVLHEAGGTLVCCGKPMELQTENTSDASLEKHKPVIKGKKVFVGSVEHPMISEHYIEWIEAFGERGERSKIFLKPGQKPEAEFAFKPLQARAFCNLHGLWKSS